MNSKYVIVVLAVLMAFSMIQESRAFTAGGGGTVPGKREFMTLKRAVGDLCRVARTHCKRELYIAKDMD
ncbi:hypothetical protein AC249_AIPGENE2343 [Exaiptasia diaphana]|nr:hypothetical protein AC249_AIPGENE2343 [Exaiptasia diaphana]